MKGWYVLHVKTGEEIEVKNRLRKEVPDVIPMVPIRTLYERHQGIVKEVIKPLFTSYVFVFMAMEIKNYYKVKQVPGVFNFLGADGPTKVPEKEMNYVLSWCSQGESVGISTVEIGEEVKVIDGPLKNMEGQIVKIDKRKGRAKVRITIFDEAKEIDLGIKFIKASE